MIFVNFIGIKQIYFVTFMNKYVTSAFLFSFFLFSYICSVFIKSERLKWAGHVARMEEGRGAFKILTGKPLGRPRRRWEDNIRMDFEEIGINAGN